MKISILIPVLNYEERLEDTLKEIKKNVKKAEIILLYDITKLELKSKIEELCKRLKSRYGVGTIFRINEKGFGSALRLGFKNVKGDVILVMMGDLCDDPKTIPKMLEKINEGYDVVAGSRYVKGGGIIGNTTKQRISSFVSILISVFSKVKCRDVTNAFKMYSKDVINSVETKSNSFDISAELTLKAARMGFSISEVPTVWKNRDIGKSKFNMIKESKNYLKWFLFSVFTMPSKLTKLIVILFIIIISWLILI